MSVTKYNRESKTRFTWVDEVENPEYKTLSEIGDDCYILGRVYFCKNAKFPHYAGVMREGFVVNFPVHMNKVFDDFINDSDAVEQTNNGRVGIRRRKYRSKNGGVYYTADFIDID